MKILSYLKQTYQRAGVRISITALVADDHKLHQQREADWFWTGTVAVLHSEAQRARRACLGEISASPFARSFRVPDDYRQFAHAKIVETARGLAGTDLRVALDSVGIYVCLLVECAEIGEFVDGESIFVDVGPAGAAVAAVHPNTFAERRQELNLA